jgi:hypothetical protein
MPPALVAHADWSVDARKRWLAKAVLQPDGRYRAFAPEPVGPLASFWDRLDRAAPSGHVLIGFDFPIGLPQAYAGRAGIPDFVAELAGFGSGAWSDFYAVAAAPAQVGLARPFYPMLPGGCRRQQLIAGLGLNTWADLLRRCDRRSATRTAACALFWTLGGQQVGKAAITGWRELLAPALRDGIDLGIWPFHGDLAELIGRHRFAVAETYPAEVYRHLRLDLRRGKRKQEVRKSNAWPLLTWADSAGVDLSSDMSSGIESGFGAKASGEDRFDAVVGLFGMLEVVLGRRPAGEPDDPAVRRIEGWILGQQAGALRPHRAKLGGDVDLRERHAGR